VRRKVYHGEGKGKGPGEGRKGVRGSLYGARRIRDWADREGWRPFRHAFTSFRYWASPTLLSLFTPSPLTSSWQEPDGSINHHSAALLEAGGDTGAKDFYCRIKLGPVKVSSSFRCPSLPSLSPFLVAPYPRLC